MISFCHPVDLQKTTELAGGGGGGVNVSLGGRKILFCITIFFSVAMTKTFQRLKQCQPTPIVSVLSLESGRIVKFVASVSNARNETAMS